MDEREARSGRIRGTHRTRKFPQNPKSRDTRISNNLHTPPSRRNMNRELKARKLKPITGDEAWMYVNPKSIEVYIWQKGKQTLSCKITEKQLKKLLTPN
jgi:hypothetical protein